MPNFQAQNTLGRASNSPYRSYLFSRNGILYFRITVPNHLQSLLKKKEIRKSLNTAKLKEARPAALRLAVLAMQYFTLLDKIRADVVRFGYKNSMQLANINGKFYDFTDTFWLDAEKSEENITELLKVFLKPLETNKEQKTNSYAENMQSEKEKVVYLAETIEKNTQNCTSRELGDTLAPAQSIVSECPKTPITQCENRHDYNLQYINGSAKKMNCTTQKKVNRTSLFLSILLSIKELQNKLRPECTSNFISIPDQPWKKPIKLLLRLKN